MKAATLIRTGSSSGSPGLSLSRRNSFSGDAPSPRISLRLGRKSNDIPKTATIRRALSESDVFQSLSSVKFPVSIPEEDEYLDGVLPEIGIPTGDDRSKIGDYYQEMLKSNPGDPLLLRNYGKYLHEVEKDTVGAEEYYGRAILASPGDGEVLSLYGKLIWETRRDGDRARAYFDQAVHVSPNDCAVMGSYAHFMWEWEADDDEEQEMSVSQVAAF